LSQFNIFHITKNLFAIPSFKDLPYICSANQFTLLRMDIISAREFCITLPHTEETFPFGDDNLVLKVGGKMYALISLNGDSTIALKCDPELAIELREKYAAVQPGYHFNKKHWNTVSLNDTIPDAKIEEWIRLSYELAIKGLTKKVRSELML
jgi:predicted DNA-binding protein (MmcQ/YjbR family)